MSERESVLEHMSCAEAVYLSTVDGGLPRIRAMVNLRRRDLYPAPAAFCREQGFHCFFATSRASGKVRELRANPVAAVYYALPPKTWGVELRGEMEILCGEALKRALWTEEWRVYWPEGQDDSDYVVLRLRPLSARGWRGTEPFAVELEQ